MTISVVIPARNEELTLPFCLEALSKQSRRADEIIVIDNASSDQTVMVAKRYGVSVLHEAKLGIWPAAARGYNQATGQIIARIDADTIVPTNWLAQIEEHIGSHQAITGPGQFYGCNNVIAYLGQLFYMRAYFFWVGAALQRTPLFGSNFAIKRSAWLMAKQTAHITRSDLHDDIDLSYQLEDIYFLPTLKVGISARALRRGLSKTIEQVKMAFRTILLHFPKQSPWNLVLRRK